MADKFSDGTLSLTRCLAPRGEGWQEIPVSSGAFGYPARIFFYPPRSLSVISAVEVADDGKIDKGPEYHVSVCRQTQSGPSRCDSNDAKWAMDQFGMDGAEEDNHVPGGVVRNFWRPVAHNLIGLECECKAEEPVVSEDKGDFIWRPPLPRESEPALREERNGRQV